MRIRQIDRPILVAYWKTLHGVDESAMIDEVGRSGDGNENVPFN